MEQVERKGEIDLEDFVINTLCQPDKVLVGLDYNPYEKVWVAKYLFFGN